MKIFEPHFLLLVFAASICLFGYGLSGYRNRAEPAGPGPVYLYWFILGIFLAIGAIFAFMGIAT